MNWHFLPVELIEALQADTIRKYGGSHGLRDRGLLESAAMRAEAKVKFDPAATIQTVGASLAYGLIKNHAFIDGNKRVGLAALVTFLKAHGYWIVVPEQEQIEIVKRVAAGDLGEEEWTAWVERSVAPFDRD